MFTSRGKRGFRLVALLFATLLTISVEAAVTASVAQAEPVQSAEVGMPFTGAWAYNIPTNADCGPADSQTSHPSCHELNGFGNWATDLHPPVATAEGTPVRLNINAPSGALSLALVPYANGGCGQRVVVRVSVGGQPVGDAYFEHLNNAVKPGTTITNGMILGYVHSWGTCNKGPHIHVGFKNATGFSCYYDFSTPSVKAGMQVNAGVSIGKLGQTGVTANKRPCAQPVQPALVVAGGTWATKGFTTPTGTAFVLDTTNLTSVSVTGPPSWNGGNPLAVPATYKPSGIASSRALSWSSVAPVTGAYTAKAVVAGKTVTQTFSINAANLLSSPTVTSVGLRSGTLNVAWSAGADSRSFLVRINPRPYSGSVTREVIFAGSARSATMNSLPVTVGVTYEVVVFGYSNDVKSPGPVTSPANQAAQLVTVVAG